MNFNKTIKEISELTERNDHTGACELGATLLVLDNLKMKFNFVSQIRDIDGHLDYATSEYRSNLYDMLMDNAKRILNDAEFNKFHGAF